MIAPDDEVRAPMVLADDGVQRASRGPAIRIASGSSDSLAVLGG